MYYVITTDSSIPRTCLHLTALISPIRANPATVPRHAPRAAAAAHPTAASARLRVDRGQPPWMRAAARRGGRMCRKRRRRLRRSCCCCTTTSTTCGRVASPRPIRPPSSGRGRPSWPSGCGPARSTRRPHTGRPSAPRTSGSERRRRRGGRSSQAWRRRERPSPCWPGVPAGRSLACRPAP